MSEETKTLNIVLKKSETSSQNLNWVNSMRAFDLHKKNRKKMQKIFIFFAHYQINAAC